MKSSTSKVKRGKDLRKPCVDVNWIYYGYYKHGLEQYNLAPAKFEKGIQCLVKALRV